MTKEVLLQLKRGYGGQRGKGSGERGSLPYIDYCAGATKCVLKWGSECGHVGSCYRVQGHAPLENL